MVLVEAAHSSTEVLEMQTIRLIIVSDVSTTSSFTGRFKLKRALMARLAFGNLAILVLLRAANNALETTANKLQTITDVVTNGD
ncbi:hypothetical protein PENCOP_c010G07089 [Penicillium coprophilum]|uniref:Uncharacterized protein n=1 Tax=Penicillium coprophilum TaxID=36646 RepID=A0A1V6UFZ7_9EURO|nr:hypothetical protein PENCOP_c010G07089 [Penicillium coprophilum]